MNLKLLSIVVFALSFVLGQAAFSHSNKCEGMQKIIDELKLDDSQKAKIKPILENLKTTIKNDRDQMKDLRKQINQQVTSDSMDQATVDSLIDKKVKIKADMMKANVSARHQIYNLLNPEQKQKHQQMMKKWEEKMSAMEKKCKMEMEDE